MSGTPSQPGVGSEAPGKSRAPDRFGFRQTFASVYLPTTIYESGIGAVTPVIPLLALQLGATPAQAALVVALLGIGQVLGDIPAGHLAARLGDRKAMLYGTVVTLIAMLVSTFAQHWLWLAAGTLLLGAVNSVFVLARQAYLSEMTPPLHRSTALSMLGGMQRVGALIGPFLGGFAMTMTGRFLLSDSPDAEWLPAAFWLAIILALTTGIVVAVVKDVDTPGRVIPKETPATTILRTNWRMFATLGIAFILVGAIRQTRATVLPLWSEHLGLTAAMSSYIFGISGLLDVALFYPGGRIMDRRGRMWVAIPSVLVLGASLVLLPLTNGFASLALVALVMGLGNGLGSGMLMTIGADMAPPPGRAPLPPV
ncbi:MAG: MFS transporter, partial [Promicromonosporaceae bacterium]|nr:MFS transporter [Promicromonosporaceae bacterium]